MSVSEIINIALAALALVVGFLVTYYKGNNKLVKAVAGYIAEAETTYTSAKSGGVKMQYVVGKLYALLPAVVRPFIPESVVQTIAQAIFDQVSAYAKLQLDKAVDKVIPAAEASKAE